MDNYVIFEGVKVSDLRDDEVKASNSEDFWKNVPDFKDGYVLTSRVAGV